MLGVERIPENQSVASRKKTYFYVCAIAFRNSVATIWEKWEKWEKPTDKPTDICSMWEKPSTMWEKLKPMWEKPVY